VSVDAPSLPVDVLPRPRGRALLLAAGTLWLPCLVPMVFGMLSTTGNAPSMFTMLLPLMPGMLLPMLLRLDGLAFVVTAAVPALLLFAGVYFAARSLPRRTLYFVQVPVIALCVLQAVVVAAHVNA